jgi:hypothetical protein
MVSQFSQSMASVSGILQINGSECIGMGLPIAFVGFFLPLCGPRKASAAAERTIRFSEPPNRKATDARRLDDAFLLALAEKLPLD